MLYFLQIRLTVSHKLYFSLLFKHEINTKNHKAISIHCYAIKSFTDTDKYITHSTFADQRQIHSKPQNKYFGGLKICDLKHATKNLTALELGKNTFLPSKLFGVVECVA